MNESYYQRNKIHILDWRKKNKDKPWYQWWNRKYSELRIKALQKISGLEHPLCIRCGCSNPKFLEVNHKNGRKGEKFKARLFWKAIVEGTRPTKDLEITCRVCNVIDFVEKTYKVRYKIEFLGA